MCSPQRDLVNTTACEHHEWPRINSSYERSNTQNNTYMLSALTAALWSGLTLKIVLYFLWLYRFFFPPSTIPGSFTAMNDLLGHRSPRKWLRAYQSGPRLPEKSTTVLSTSGRERKKKNRRDKAEAQGAPHYERLKTYRPRDMHCCCCCE